MITYESVREITPDVSRLFSVSFSDIEKIPEENLLRTFGRGGELVKYYDDGEFIGFTYFFHNEDKTFWVYFATEPEKRSKGYGSKIIPLLRELHPDQRIFLVIEPCDEGAEDIEIRKRRHGFYIRNGCSDAGFQAVSDDAWFDIMYVKGSLTKEEVIDTIQMYEDIHNGRK